MIYHDEAEKRSGQKVLAGQRLAFIGGGVMAEAMLAGALDKQLVEAHQIFVSHPRSQRGEELADKYHIQATTSNLEAARAADIIILCVKPQRLKPIFSELVGKIEPGQLIVSIVAGATSAAIAERLKHPAVVRAMPNTPAQIGQGITVWSSTSAVSQIQKEQVQALLSALGQEMWFEEERFVDMATAISGTGPAYVFLVMESLIDAAVHLGFSRRDARELVTQTLLGSVLFAQESQKHPAELRNMVTSPNGTSAEALYQLEKGSVRTIFSKAVYAAYQKTSILSEMISKSE